MSDTNDKLRKSATAALAKLLRQAKRKKDDAAILEVSRAILMRVEQPEPEAPTLDTSGDLDLDACDASDLAEFDRIMGELQALRDRVTAKKAAGLAPQKEPIDFTRLSVTERETKLTPVIDLVPKPETPEPKARSERAPTPAKPEPPIFYESAEAYAKLGGVEINGRWTSPAGDSAWESLLASLREGRVTLADAVAAEEKRRQSREGFVGALAAREDDFGI